MRNILAYRENIGKVLFVILEVTAEVRINTKPKIRLLNVLVKRKVVTRQFQFQREIYGIPVISLPTHPFIFSSS
jgi:hypothetical protein